MHDFFPNELLLNRRQALLQTACGFGALATSAMFAQAAQDDSVLHFAPKAKRIIFLFMQGGVSQVDSFDHKPDLARLDGSEHAFDDSRTIAKTGVRGSNHRLMRSPWKFRPYGESQKQVSDLFPEIAGHVDKLCFLHSMQTKGVAHGPATLFLHCGATTLVRPSLGSWLLYGVGSENANLPGFVSIAPSIGNGGPRNYGSAFLPAKYQGTKIGSTNNDSLTLEGLSNEAYSPKAQREQLDFLMSLNAMQIDRRNGAENSQFEAVQAASKQSWDFQQIAPEILDLSTESAATLEQYGIGQAETENYGKRCLLARRLCESGVRFIQVNYGDNSANPAWDQHSNIERHEQHARAVDKPIAGLLADLEQRGLLDETLVWWGSEFGRTPYAESNGTGRDHNPNGFTVWLAGAGVKPGMSYGMTDEFGFKAVENRVHMHDLHATLLRILGLDHKRLTFSYAGRDFRLTDVYGRVIDSILS